MKPLRYLEIKKDEFQAQLEEVGIPEQRINAVLQDVQNIISKLSVVRHSKLLTIRLLDAFEPLKFQKVPYHKFFSPNKETCNPSDNQPQVVSSPEETSEASESEAEITEISLKDTGSDETFIPHNKTVERIHIEELLIKSVKQDKSYTYAYNYIAQQINKVEGHVYYPVHDISDTEILNLIETEQSEQEVVKDKNKIEDGGYMYTTIPEKELIHELYSHCSEIVSCSQSEFNKAIRTADFSRIEVKTTYKVQHLLFKLSKQMGDKWYTEAVKSKNWSKTVCSGHKKRLEVDLWRKQLDKILP